MYTRRDYPALNDLMLRHSQRGLAVLAFPTAQFMNQEPGDTEEEILHSLAHVRPGGGFVPGFPLMAKGNVNGHDEPALWAWLKRLCPMATSFNYGSISWSPVKANDIGWNFEKFLIDREGRPCRRYDHETPAAELEDDIVSVLESGCPRVSDNCDLAAVSAATRTR